MGRHIYVASVAAIVVIRGVKRWVLLETFTVDIRSPPSRSTQKSDLNKLKSNSVDLIFTDPPYDKESLRLYKDLGEMAFILLREGGSLITYFGQYTLPGIINSLISAKLVFWWQLYILLEGQNSRYFDPQIKVQIKAYSGSLREISQLILAL